MIADNAGIAEDALEHIGLDIEHLAAVTSREAAARNEILLFDGTTSNRPITLTAVRGDADAAFREADYVRRERFVVQRHSAIPMEPRGLMAEWDAGRGRLTVWGASKVPFAIRRVLGAAPGAGRRCYPDGRERHRRQLRRPRRVLSGGLPDSVRRAARRAAGQMDRGSAGAFSVHQSRARHGVRRRDRLPARRNGSRNARPCLRGHRRLHSHQCGHAGPQRRAGHFWALQRSEHSTSMRRCW